LRTQAVDGAGSHLPTEKDKPALTAGRIQGGAQGGAREARLLRAILPSAFGAKMRFLNGRAISFSCGDHKLQTQGTGLAESPEVAGCRMDTIIFLLILGTLFAMRGQRRWLVLGLFFASLIAMVLLFHFHVTSRLPLSF